MKEKATLIESFVLPTIALAAFVLIGPLAILIIGIVLALWIIVELVKWVYSFISVAAFYVIIVLKAVSQKINHTIHSKTIVADKRYSKSDLL